MTPLADTLRRIGAALVEEATPLPGQSRAYGRPHGHPRTRHEPRYSMTGERLAGSVKVRPDCPSPIRGRCECPPDGTWRPSVGVLRADTTAHHAVYVPTDRHPDAAYWTVDGVWVDAVYEQAPDGLWHCRRPMRRALEILRGVSVPRWSIAVRLLRGDVLSSVWGSHGAPPDPEGDALRILRQLERWATEQREAEYEYRPRQWWDKPKVRSLPKSDAQVNAEHEPNVESALQSERGLATLPPEVESDPSVGTLKRSPASDAVFRSSSHPARSGARAAVGHPVPFEASA